MLEDPLSRIVFKVQLFWYIINNFYFSMNWAILDNLLVKENLK